MSFLEEYPSLIMDITKITRDYTFLSYFYPSQASSMRICSRAVTCYVLQVEHIIVFILGHAKHTGQFISMFFPVNRFNK